MSREATEEAIRIFRTMFGSERDYTTLVLGSLHGIDFKFETQVDWLSRDIGEDANFRYVDINHQAKWNLIINCCCEHMYPMSDIKIPGLYVLQTNDRYSDEHPNRCSDPDKFIEQSGVDTVEWISVYRIDDVKYITLIGEKYGS